ADEECGSLWPGSDLPAAQCAVRSSAAGAEPQPTPPARAWSVDADGVAGNFDPPAPSSRVGDNVEPIWRQSSRSRWQPQLRLPTSIHARSLAWPSALDSTLQFGHSCDSPSGLLQS